MTHTDSSTTLVREITIEAPAAAVFAALTEPDQLTAWWSTSTYRTTSMECDLRVGGAWKVSGSTVAGKAFSVGGVYRVVDPPGAIEFTWRHDWGKPTSEVETVVRYDLDERAGVTLLRLTHWGFEDVRDRDDHTAGWTAVLDLLRAHLERAGTA